MVIIRTTLLPSVPLGVIKALNVTVKSEGANDPGRSGNGLSYIVVNGKNYAPQTKGFNVAVFDALSGKKTTVSTKQFYLANSFLKILRCRKHHRKINIGSFYVARNQNSNKPLSGK